MRDEILEVFESEAAVERFVECVMAVLIEDEAGVEVDRARLARYGDETGRGIALMRRRVEKPGTSLTKLTRELYRRGWKGIGGRRMKWYDGVNRGGIEGLLEDLGFSVLSWEGREGAVYVTV